jgi:hypothetical protein
VDGARGFEPEGAENSGMRGQRLRRIFGRGLNAAGITPPEGRAWYKTTVEAYLRHKDGERLSVLGKLAPSRFARWLTS